MQPKITFKRITNPKGKDFNRLWKIYEECFPIRDERETKSHLYENARGYSFQEDGKYAECFSLCISVNSRPAGGVIFNYVEGKICGRRIGFGVDWYIFLDKRYRELGLGKLLHEKMVASLRELSLRRGSILELVICELNDPRRMKPADEEKDMEVIIDPAERFAFFNSLGYHEIDPSGFSYIQPQLTENKHPCKELMLAIKPVGKKFHNKIPTGYLKQLLWLYTWAGFDGIPGSNLNGHRNPETDKAYMEMKRQLEILERQKSVSLIPLVREPDIKIEPLSKRTLEPAIKLLNSIFHYEKEIPQVSLHASLNPEPYRKYLNEWKIPELRYWVALSKSGKVIGTVGLYSYKKGRKEASWVGWFSVSPKYRKHGIGTKLLDFAIYNAKLTGKKYLRLYTTTNPNELAAHKLYEKTGFVKTGEEPQKGKDKKIFYRLDLRK